MSTAKPANIGFQQVVQFGPPQTLLDKYSAYASHKPC